MCTRENQMAMATWKGYSVLVTLIVIITGLFTIPIVIFYASREEGLNEWKATILDSLSPHLDRCLGETTPASSNGSEVIRNVSSACRMNVTGNATFGTQLDCHPNFIQLCGVCTPRCATISLNDRSGTMVRLEDVCTVLALVLGVIGFIAFLTMSVIRRKQMFAFPSVLVIYEAVLQVLPVFATLIGYMGGKRRMYCSHTDVVQAFRSAPTAYTTISGIIFQYAAAGPYMFWVVHISYMIVLLQFPVFGNKKLRKRSVTVTIHVIAVVAILLFQLLWPIITLAGFQYDIIRFPPLVGQTSNMDLLFYTVVVPATVAVGSGVVLLAILIFRIHQSLHSTSDLKNDFSKSKPKFFSAPEIKLLILSICLSIIGVVTIGTYSAVIGGQSAYAERFVNYSICLLCGNDPKCTMESSSDHFRVASNAIGQLAYCVLFLVNIVFTMNASDMSRIAKVLCCTCTWYKTSRGTTTSSTTPNLTAFTKSDSLQPSVNLADSAADKD